MSIRWLILTDHTTHSATNSLYALASAIRLDERSGEMWIATKGNEQNVDFFRGVPDAPLHATAIQSPLSFQDVEVVLEAADPAFDDGEIDVVMIRMPQPVSRAFLFSLRKRWPDRMIINDPIGINETASKQFLLQVSHLCPPIQLCHSIAEAVTLSQQHEIVLKPLYAYRGQGMFRLSKDAIWLEDKRHSLAELHEVIKELDFPMLAMRFLPRVTEGDKRTIIVNQQIVGSALRTPAPGSWLCNVSHGGTATMAEADADELKIAAELTPLLYEKGIVMYGFDTLVNDDGRRVLSEINTLSIGGLKPMEEMSGRPVIAEAVELLYGFVGTDSRHAQT